MSSIKKSFFWSGVEQVGPQIVSFAISIALARLLDPTAYGLVGMLALFMAVAGVFADAGMSSALIQRKNLTADDETSVFALNVAVGGGLAMLLCLISPLVARFYQQPILVPLLCINSLTIVISSFALVQSALLCRKMQFQHTAFIGTASTMASGVVGVLMAYLGYGVWSLMGAALAAGLVRTGLLWKFSDWRPIGKIRRESIRSMWGFSSNLLGCSLLGVAYQNMYTVIIGKVYSTESLGFYNQANTLRMLPVTTIGGIVHRVSFPLFSSYQDDKPLMLQRMREIIRGTLLLSAGALTLLVVVADPLIPLLLTEKWRPTIPLLRILCYAGVFFPIHILYLSTIQAQGLTYLSLRLESIKMVLGIIVVLLFYRHGVTALAWSVVLMTGFAYFINVWFNVKLLGYRWRMQAFDILPTFLLCAVSGLSAWWLATFVTIGPVVVLLVQSVTFVAFVGSGVILLRKIFFVDVWGHLLWGIDWLRQRVANG